MTHLPNHRNNPVDHLGVFVRTIKVEVIDGEIESVFLLQLGQVSEDTIERSSLNSGSL
jgi:hypothetical protein